MRFLFLFLTLVFACFSAFPKGVNVYGLGIYDVKFDGSEDNQTSDFRYERRFDKSILEIGPSEDNFFFLKPFVGFEYTGDSASYFLAGIFIEDNLGQLFQGETSGLSFIPSFGLGLYEDGDGKNLGNDLQFRTTLELNYKFENNNRIGLSFGHISNANLGDKNPGVEIIILSYQIPY